MTDRAWVETVLKEAGGFTNKEQRQLLATYDYIAAQRHPTSTHWLSLSEGTTDVRYIMTEVFVQLAANGYLAMPAQAATRALLECAPRAESTIMVHYGGEGSGKREVMPLLAAKFLVLVNPCDAGGAPFRDLQVSLSHPSTEMVANDWRDAGTGEWHDMVAFYDPEFTVYAHYLAHFDDDDDVAAVVAAMWKAQCAEKTKRIRDESGSAAAAAADEPETKRARLDD
jgi:hypothetical protein